MAWLDQPLPTERLLLRSWRDADRESLSVLFTDPSVRLYLGGVIADRHLVSRVDAVLMKPWGSFCVTGRDLADVIGSCELDRGRGELEISYAFRREFWGQGLAYEAVKAVIEWTWKATADVSVTAVTQLANTASRQLLVRLGFDQGTTFEEFNAWQVLYRLPRS